MLRTNTKQARANVRKYIMEDFEYIAERAEYDGIELTENDEEEALATVYRAFLDEYGNRARARRENTQEAFTNWAQGLAMGGLFCYYYNIEAVQVLGDILEQTEAERTRFTEEQAERTLTYLIFKECQKAYNR